MTYNPKIHELLLLDLTVMKWSANSIHKFEQRNARNLWLKKANHDITKRSTYEIAFMLQNIVH